MIAALASLLGSWKVAARFTRPLAWAIVAAALAAVLIVGTKVIIGSIGDRAVVSHELEIDNELQRGGRTADQNITRRQTGRAATQDQARKEFDDATADLPDEGLTCRQRRDICGELRDAGTDTSLVPECGNICAGNQASSQPRNSAQK